MADLILPANNRLSQRFSVAVPDGSIGIGLRWSPLNERWFITLDGVTRDRVIVSNELLGRVAGGFVMALPLHDTDDDPGINAWGATHYLVWIEGFA